MAAETDPASPRGDKIGVLFVCMGNICRSPMARGIFEHLAAAKGVADRFDVDSCGTGGWHAGDGADPRTLATLAGHGIQLSHRARQFQAGTDLARFHHIFAMDAANLRQLEAMGCPPQRMRLLRDCDPESCGQAAAAIEVPDPYYGGDDGFEKIFAMIHAASVGLLARLTSG